MRKALFLLWIFVCVLFAAADVLGQEITQGSLYAANAKGVELGACPLKNTAVDVEISGFAARVRVVQDFENTFSEPIEAVYTFPLSQNGAVDYMTMTVGTRTIRGKVLKREEARKVYETAKTEGKTASLLDQERPNIFTQSVANIMPGESVKIEISYIETLNYEDGEYEFVFPMTVGPRYIPGSVKDAAKISPPIAMTRAGHDISINVRLNAGVPIEAIRSTSHDIDQLNLSSAMARVNLRGETTLPNKDFILRYDVTGKRIEDAVIAHRGIHGGFFTMVLQPPDKIASEDRTPKEIVFVLDTSGSMYGFPIEKAKEAMKLSLDGLYPEDTFNLITFAGDTRVLFDGPVHATQANIELAQEFLASRSGGGGTEMMKAIKAALVPSDSKEHLRIVCFMTDGYVGNENEIIAEVQRHPKARVFSFGIGNSVNRFLLDKMAEAGKGEVEYVSLEDEGSKAAKRFYERVRSPLLTDLSIDWNGMPVVDVYPSKLGDLFSAKPVIVKGRYTKGAEGMIRLKGTFAGSPYVREIAVDLPDAEPANDSLASLWARQRIDELSGDALIAKEPEKINKQITDLGLEFGLMTHFTSFVAVEEKIVNQNGNPVKVEVPVAAPDGVDMTKAGGRQEGEVARLNQTQYFSPIASGSGTGSGSGGGAVANRSVSPLPISGGVMSATEVVTVSGDASAIDMSSSSVTTTIKPDSTGNLRVVTRSGSGGSGSGNGYGRGSSDDRSTQKNQDTPFRQLEIISSLQRPPSVSYGVISGRVQSLPIPEFPAAARAVGATGVVSVYVFIDEEGKVTSAQAISGHPLLRASAVAAAKSARFVPTIVSGKPVKTVSVINYSFVNPVKEARTLAAAGSLAIRNDKSRPPTETELREIKLKTKLHAWLYAVVDRLEKKTSPTPNESQFVRDGKANVSLTLTKPASANLIETLKALGFEVDKSEGTTITGTIALEKLRDLADIEEVKYILPRDIKAS